MPPAWIICLEYSACPQVAAAAVYVISGMSDMYVSHSREVDFLVGASVPLGVSTPGTAGLQVGALHLLCQRLDSADEESEAPGGGMAAPASG